MKKRVGEVMKVSIGGGAPQPNNLDNITTEIVRNFTSDLPVRRVSIKKCSELSRPSS